MVPFVRTLDEFRGVKKIMAENGLSKEVDPAFKLWIMVEVPSAALLADRMAKSIDFFSIGTNDLTQYTLAVDRTNAQVAHLASGFHPAVLYLVQRTITSAHAAGRWCGMCGEFAGEPLAVPILIGMGLDEFSMSPARIPNAKQLIRRLDVAECQILAERALAASTAGEVKELVKSFLEERAISPE